MASKSADRGKQKIKVKNTQLQKKAEQVNFQESSLKLEP